MNHQMRPGARKFKGGRVTPSPVDGGPLSGQFALAGRSITRTV